MSVTVTYITIVFFDREQKFEELSGYLKNLS